MALDLVKNDRANVDAGPAGHNGQVAAHVTLGSGAFT